MMVKRFVLPGLAAMALASAPAHAQDQPNAPAAETSALRHNIDPNIFLYIGLPALVVIILAIAAGSSDDDRPASP